MQNFGYNPYFNRPPELRILPVSNIMEANSTPVNGFDPVFFYNRAENVIYKKQINNTGAAPIQIFKLEPPASQNSMTKPETDINTYKEDFKALNDKIDGLIKILKKEDKTK